MRISFHASDEMGFKSMEVSAPIYACHPGRHPEGSVHIIEQTKYELLHLAQYSQLCYARIRMLGTAGGTAGCPCFHQ